MTLANYKSEFAIIACLALASSSLARAQQSDRKVVGKPVDTSVCEIWKRPWAYDNQIVRVRGYVSAGMETATLIDEKCPDKTISFRFAEGSAGSNLFSTVERRGKRSRQRRPRVVVKVVNDKSLELLWNYWRLSAAGERCLENTPFESLPDCRTYRATATFIGRVDGVSKAVHAAHLKKSAFTTPDWKGFGDMGMFEAEIVAGSAENVVAVEEPVKWTPALMEVPR